MKSLLFLALALTLAGCKYQSMEQAVVACKEWEEKNWQVSLSKMEEKPPVRPDFEKQKKDELESLSKRTNKQKPVVIDPLKPETLLQAKRQVLQEENDRAAIRQKYDQREQEFLLSNQEYYNKARLYGSYSCSNEQKTNQVLGSESKDGKPRRVVKHFRY
ncbi:hypothetical protein [Synechococcus sp. MIT S9507]|uniref:hypothetical protein n=1 Tax=Synechococcus sp. MIT S9507 TaxID=3082544 RepID=UPI0039B51994